MESQVNYHEVVKFMKDFGIDILNRFDELIIDMKTNTYAYIGGCNTFEDVRMRVVYALCRPIGKGLEIKDSNRLLKKLNDYFKVNLTREDMLLMYQELCYTSKMEEFKAFIKDGFPIKSLVKEG
jgi:hypothetical protein